MEISYRRELDHNYLVLEERDFQENYQINMLLKNRIPGFLECRMTRVDRTASFYYEITSRQNLRLVLERKRLSLTEMIRLLEGLERAAQTCEEYLLDGERILLQPDFIYLDPDEWKIWVCFYPFEKQELGSQLLGLAEYLLDHLDRQDSGAVTLGYEFYRMAGEENPSIRKLLEEWGNAEAGSSQSVSAETAGNQENEEEKSVFSYEKFGADGMADRYGTWEGARENRLAENFPEWVDTSSGGTACLAGVREPGLFLRSESAAYPDLRVGKESFMIGKKKDAVDGWLKARGISRIHAKISREEDCYYLTDLNSTNGTFLNGGRLGINEKARLRPGDSVGFADIRYVVEG